YRHTLDDGVGEVEDDVNGAAVRDIHGIQPCWLGEWRAILCISQKVNLVNVERMQFGSFVDNTPMLIRTDTSACHRRCIRRKFAPVNVEAVLVFGESNNEIRCSLLQGLDVDWPVNRWAVVGGMCI